MGRFDSFILGLSGWVGLGLVWLGLAGVALGWFGLDWSAFCWIGLDCVGVGWIGMEWSSMRKDLTRIPTEKVHDHLSSRWC